MENTKDIFKVIDSTGDYVGAVYGADLKRLGPELVCDYFSWAQGPLLIDNDLMSTDDTMWSVAEDDANSLHEETQTWGDEELRGVGGGRGDLSGFDVTWALDAGVDPKFDHVPELDLETLEEEDPDGLYYGRRVIWYREGGHYVVRVKADLVMAMIGNSWDWNHLMGLYETIADGERPVFETPAARIWTIDEADVAYHDEILAEGEDAFEAYLEEGGIQRRYTKADIGQYKVQLVDGNHRAFSAILAGESYIFVTVGANYRDDVDPDDWE